MVSLTAPTGLLEAQVRGRDVIVGELTGLYRRRRRQHPRVWILHGMGGAGKTTIALAVDHHHRAAGVQVWWVSAATATGALSSVTGRPTARRAAATIEG
jgi:adenylylsulfate kinase-like enzyme